MRSTPSNGPLTSRSEGQTPACGPRSFLAVKGGATGSTRTRGVVGNVALKAFRLPSALVEPSSQHRGVLRFVGVLRIVAALRIWAKKQRRLGC